MTDLTQNHSHTRHGAARRSAFSWTRISRLAALWRSRRDLAQLDRQLLRDIGVDRSAADEEAQRPVWDVPATWHD